jgi:ABC-type transporter Mla maintaining outer membrane lipid asymmetry ATPase subunit MlaF
VNAPGPKEESPARSAAAVIEMIGVSIGTAGALESAAVEGIDWAIARGDYWVIGGPPASGKSDLLATLAGLYRPLKGTLRFFGRDVATMDEDAFLVARLRIGLVFENGGRLFNHLTVAENIALPLRYHDDQDTTGAEERVGRILEATGLAPLTMRRPVEIKHAWRQRVGLARALALAPEVLLFDNPLAGLGPQESRWWREFLAQLAAGHEVLRGRPATLVIASHDLRPWADQGRQFALLRPKRWVRIGGREELAGSAEPLLGELLAAEFSFGRPGGP